LPSPSIRTVERSIPMYFLPYMLFSTHAPYTSTTAPLSSEASINGRSYLALNFSWLAVPSLETPTTSMPPA
jgi:hypothetical protein